MIGLVLSINWVWFCIIVLLITTLIVTTAPDERFSHLKEAWRVLRGKNEKHMS